MNDEEFKAACAEIKALWDAGDHIVAGRIFQRIEVCRAEVCVLGNDGVVRRRLRVENGAAVLREIDI